MVWEQRRSCGGQGFRKAQRPPGFRATRRPSRPRTPRECPPRCSSVRLQVQCQGPVHGPSARPGWLGPRVLPLCSCTAGRQPWALKPRTLRGFHSLRLHSFRLFSFSLFFIIVGKTRSMNRHRAVPQGWSGPQAQSHCCSAVSTSSSDRSSVPTTPTPRPGSPGPTPSAVSSVPAQGLV